MKGNCQRLLSQFHKHIEDKRLVVSEEEPSFKAIIEEWAELIFCQSIKGLIPIFVTGSGISHPAVPNMKEIIQQLEKEYGELKNDIRMETVMKRAFVKQNILPKILL